MGVPVQAVNRVSEERECERIRLRLAWVRDQCTSLRSWQLSWWRSRATRRARRSRRGKETATRRGQSKILIRNFPEFSGTTETRLAIGSAVPAAERGGVDLGVGAVDVVIGQPRKSLGPIGVRDPSIPVDPRSIFGPNVAGRRFNSLRALAQIHGETGSLETAPTATQSPRCSHSGFAPGSPPFFSLYFGRFRRSLEKRRGNERRPRRGRVPCPADRLASRVLWSGVGAFGTPAHARRTSDRGTGGTAQCCRQIRVSHWPHQGSHPGKSR